MMCNMNVTKLCYTVFMSKDDDSNTLISYFFFVTGFATLVAAAYHGLLYLSNKIVTRKEMVEESASLLKVSTALNEKVVDLEDRVSSLENNTANLEKNWVASYEFEKDNAQKVDIITK